MKKRVLFFILAVFLSCKSNIDGLKTDPVLADNIVNVQDSENIVIDSAIPIPTGVSVTKGIYSDKIVISWNQVFYKNSIIAYHIYRIEKGASGEIVSNIRVTGQFTINRLFYEDTIDKGIIPGKDYYYMVRAINLSSPDGSGSNLSAMGTGFMLSSVERIMAGFRESMTQINISWSSVKGANFYYLYRAQEVVSGVVPELKSFKKFDQAMVDLNYSDNGTIIFGEVEPGKTYYYYVEACNSKNSVSKISPIVKGALLVAGTPGVNKIVSVSQEEISGSIRIVWENKEDLKNFKLYRFSKSEMQSGNYVGTEVDVNISQVIVQAGNCIYYDKINPSDLNTTYYYRVAGINDFGVGQLSEFSEADSYLNEGRSFNLPDNRNVFIFLKSLQELEISWNKAGSSSGISYFVFRLVPTKGDPDPDATSLMPHQWGEPIAVSTAVKYVDTVVAISGKYPGYDLKTDRVYYRVLAFNSNIIADYKVVGTNINIIYKPNKDYSADLKAKLGLTDEQVLLALGRSEYYNHKEFVLRLPEVISYSATEGTVDSGINVVAKLSTNIGIGVVYSAKLVRTCEYGDEEGVYPLSLPNPGTTFNYTKLGVAPISNVIEYDIKDAISLSGDFNWSDPMPDFDKNGAIKETGMVWNYAKWDREAWKAILRKKMVDMNRYVKVSYKIIIAEIDNTSIKSESSTFKGWPNLSYKEFAWLSKWQMDCALNTIWQLNVPRCCWSKTVAWLPGLNVSNNGEFTGKMSFNVGDLTNLSGSGGSSGDFYGDWPGYKIKLSMTLKVSIEAGKPREVAIDDVDVITPLYSGKVSLKVVVRDFGPYWGLWNTNGKYIKGGYYKVSMSYPVPKGVKSLNPAETNMIGQGDDWSDFFNYEIHGYNWDTDVAPDERTTYAKAGVDSWHYTRINWPVRPYPANNGDLAADRGRTIDYNLGAW